MCSCVRVGRARVFGEPRSRRNVRANRAVPVDADRTGSRGRRKAGYSRQRPLAALWCGECFDAGHPAKEWPCCPLGGCSAREVCQDPALRSCLPARRRGGWLAPPTRSKGKDFPGVDSRACHVFGCGALGHDLFANDSRGFQVRDVSRAHQYRFGLDSLIDCQQLLLKSNSTSTSLSMQGARVPCHGKRREDACQAHSSNHATSGQDTPTRRRWRDHIPSLMRESIEQSVRRCPRQRDHCEPVNQVATSKIFGSVYER